MSQFMAWSKKFWHCSQCSINLDYAKNDNLKTLIFSSMPERIKKIQEQNK